MSATAGARTGRVRVLAVDDEPGLTELPAAAVADAGRRPHPAPGGQTVLRPARGRAPHAVLLDGMPPDLDGLQVLRGLRYDRPRLPVLMRTARDAVEHRVDGLEAGADDCVTEPFSPEEVVLRLRAPLRRAGTEQPPADDSVRVLGDLVLTGESRAVQRAGTPIRLTAKEFDLLSLLLDRPRQVPGKKTRILGHVRSTSLDGGGNLVEAYVSSPHRTIDRGRAPAIRTARGRGHVVRPVEDGR
ncbi:response regulator transcription factor [Streptomyces sp. NPDC086519]|uniref:response regulator transcription factor n=1 Tax=Streptomyces sp. NPDC086519 TaxID=3154863 RepID=UPI0034251BAB